MSKVHSFAELFAGARPFVLRPLGHDRGDNSAVGRPTRLTLLHDTDGSMVPAQLLLDRTPLPEAQWRYDAARGTLDAHWAADGTPGLVHLQLAGDGLSARGVLGLGARLFDVAADLPPIAYTCSVAAAAGAYVRGTPPALSLNWTVGSQYWNQATWLPNALLFTFQPQQQFIVGQAFYDLVVTFQDLQTGANWAPLSGSFGCVISNDFLFAMTLSAGTLPPPDDRSAQPAPAAMIPTLFPFRLAFQLSPTAIDLAGAMLTVVDAQNGTVLGVQGSTTGPSIAGFYATGGSEGGFAIHHGTLYIADAPVPGATLYGRVLSWTALDAAQQHASGLPRSGSITFEDNGARFVAAAGGASGARVFGARASALAGPKPAYAAIAAPTITPTLYTLALMTQFELRSDGWLDVVQEATTADMNQILLYFMPPELRQTYWNTSQPTLSPGLQAIAAMAPAGSNPGQWYGSLAVAFLTTVIPSEKQPGANQLNAIRAQNWLRSELATSPVYRAQGPALYAREWAARNPAIADFLADQSSNAGYSAMITSDAAAWIGELTAEIADADLLAEAKAMVKNLSTSAADRGLYWAYTYFRYATMPAQLDTIRMLALGTAAGADGSAFMRRVQTDAAILTALDGANLFSNEYLKTVQGYILGNILPQFADYGVQQDGFAEAVRAVLNQLALTYAGNTTPEIAAIAGEATILTARSDFADLVAAVQAAAVGAPPGWDAAAVMAAAIAARTGQPGANLICIAMASLQVSGVANGVMGWTISPGGGSGISPGTIITAVKYTLQVAYVVTKWGLILSSALSSYASKWEAFTGLFSTDMLIRANTAVQRGFTKWLIGNRVIEVPPESELFGNLFAEPAEEESAAVSRIFGRNIDEFVALRLGALFSLASLIASAVALAGSDTADDVIVNSLSVTSSALGLIATAGEWALSAASVTTIGGIEVASICSVVSVFGIIAAVVGIGFMLYRYFKPVPTPAQTFATQYATPAGFFMPYGSEIDTFIGYANAGEATRVGLAWGIPGAPGQVLRVGADGAIGAGTPDYGYATVLFVSTDGLGQSTVTALVSVKGVQTAQLLTARQDGSVVFAPAAAASDAAAARQRWTITLQATPTMDGDYPASGPFHVALSGQSLFLTWTSGGNFAMAATAQAWLLQQVPMVPAGLTMADLALLTTAQGASVTPRLAQPGSPPLTWSVAPPLPAFLALDTTSGAVRVAASAPQPLPVTAATRHTLTLRNAVQTGTLTAQFQVSVAAA